MDYKNKLVLLTGGSGFLSHSIIPKLLERGAKVRAMARNEGNLIKTKQKFPEIEVFPGDISDPICVKQAMAGADGVIAAGAWKIVGLSEEFSREAVKSNVVGTLNLLEESLNHNLDFFVNISTDKCAKITCCYSATKYLTEVLTKQFSKLAPGKYRNCRYGNVLGSTASVLTIWRDLVSQGKGVTLTDTEATRFWWTADDAAEFIFETIENAPDAEPYIPNMKGASMNLLLQAVIEKYAPKGVYIPINVTSLNPSDNKHEALYLNGPLSNEVEQFTKEELIALI